MSTNEVKLREWCRYVEQQLAKRGHRVDNVKVCWNRVVFVAQGKIVYAAGLK